MAAKTVKIYLSYARMDRVLVDRLKKHLLPLQQKGLAEVLDDLEVAPGGDWNMVSDKHLNEADIILLMISPDFLDSDYCYSKEMRHALERHSEGSARVIPIILRPVHWQDAPFSRLQVLPIDGRPVTRSDDIDETFGDITYAISRAIQAPLASPLLGQVAMRRISRRRVLIGGLTATAAITAAGLYWFVSGHGSPVHLTPTPTPPASRLIYQADWSNGMGGWSNPSGSVGNQIWTSKNEMLLCSGKLAGNPSSLLITPPYLPGIPNYAVVADIQFLAINSKTGPAYFGLIARDPANGSGSFGYLAGVSGSKDLDAVIFQTGQKASASQVLVRLPFQPGTSLHRYRIELRGNKYTFFVDGALVFQVVDSTFLEPGLVGLVSSACQLTVNRFQVFALE